MCIRDSRDGTELRNKRNMRLLPKFPELSQLHRQVKKNCILDGELAVIKDGKPNFFEVQRRSLLSNQFKIRLAASSAPACFTAFDILYLDGKPVMDEPLAQRKKLLGKTVSENQYLAVSRFIEEKGSAFYRLAEQNNLEGLVAKRKNRKYRPATKMCIRDSCRRGPRRHVVRRGYDHAACKGTGVGPERKCR